MIHYYLVQVMEKEKHTKKHQKDKIHKSDVFKKSILECRDLKCVIKSL